MRGPLRSATTDCTPAATELLDPIKEGVISDDQVHELGDLLFAVVNVARHLDVEPEAALRVATHKFRRRFEAVEMLAADRGIAMRDADLTELDALWDEVKRAE